MVLISLLLVLLCVSPILGLAIACIIFSVKKNDRFVTHVVFVYFGLFLGIINTLKIPESDLLNYILFFENAGSYNFINYLAIENKEYFYFSLNYLFYYITNGDFNIFLIFITALSYYCLFYSVRMLHKHLNLDQNAYWIALIVMFLFPNLFTMSAHLMRQFLGLSLISVFLVKNIVKGNKASIPFFILAVLSHTSTLVFALAFIPLLKKRLSSKKLVQLIVFTILIVLSGEVFMAYLSNLPVIGFAFERYGRRDAANWNTESLGVLSLLIQLVVIMFLYVGIVKKEQFKKSQINLLFNMVLLLVIFVLINYNNTEISGRFNFYTYLFLPFSMYFFNIIFLIKNTKIKRLINSMVLVLFLFWFVFKLNYGTWQFSNLEKLVLTFI